MLTCLTMMGDQEDVRLHPNALLDRPREQAGVPATVPIAVASGSSGPSYGYARWKDQDAALTEIRDVFLKALPGISVAMRGCWGPFEDTEGVSSHFDGAAGKLAVFRGKKIKRIRVDLLTSCAKVLCMRGHGF